MCAILRSKSEDAFSKFSFGGGVFLKDFVEEGFGLLQRTIEVFESVFVALGEEKDEIVKHFFLGTSHEFVSDALRINGATASPGHANVTSRAISVLDGTLFTNIDDFQGLWSLNL